MEKTGCKIICGAPATLEVKGLMMMMMMMMNSNSSCNSDNSSNKREKVVCLLAWFP